MKVWGSVLVALGASVLACAPASAQNGPYDPYAAGASLSAPRYFDGLYAGATISTIENQHGNIFTGPFLRDGVGALVGWNHYLAEQVVIGVEARGIVNTDMAGGFGYEVYGMTRLGLLASDDVMVYLTGGLGVVDGVAVGAFGPGVEARLWDSVTLRLEGLGFVQAGPGPGPNVPNVSGLGINSSLIWHFGGDQGNLSGPGIVIADLSERFDFSGAYAGTGFSFFLNMPYNFFTDIGFGLHPTRLDFGGFAGMNYQLAESVVGGFEVQAGLDFDSSGDGTYNVLGLARVGLQPLDRALIYAAGGVGVLQDKAAYVAGGGIEFALFENASIRAEILALGELSATPTVAGFSATKSGLTAVMHLD